MSAGKKNLILNSTAVDLGCGGCRRPRLFLSHIFNSHKSNYSRRATTAAAPKKLKHKYDYSSGSLGETSAATTTLSSDMDVGTPSSEEESSDIKSSRTVQGFGRLGGESVAVEQDSDDPYLDFRQSMLQMILENEIYSKDDLKELLNCFIQLNSPYYHGIIVRAFTEIWNGVFSVRPAAASPFLHGRWESREF